MCAADLSLADHAGLIVGVGAGLIALVALLSDRAFRTRDALAKLLERFETAGFMTLMWRMEQVTRGDRPAWSLHWVDPDVLTDKLEKSDKPINQAKAQLIRDSLAQDWTNQDAHMHQVYFFALRVHAWVISSPFRRAHRVRLLNESFGYQLLSTLLDHRVVACRLTTRGNDHDYYPTQYGCLDPACRKLVQLLANDLLDRSRTFTPSPGILRPIRKKRRETDNWLAVLDDGRRPDA